MVDEIGEDHRVLHTNKDDKTIKVVSGQTAPALTGIRDRKLDNGYTRMDTVVSAWPHTAPG